MLAGSRFFLCYARLYPIERGLLLTYRRPRRVYLCFFISRCAVHPYREDETQLLVLAFLRKTF